MARYYLMDRDVDGCCLDDSDVADGDRWVHVKVINGRICFDSSGDLRLSLHEARRFAQDITELCGREEQRQDARKGA